MIKIVGIGTDLFWKARHQRLRNNKIREIRSDSQLPEFTYNLGENSQIGKLKDNKQNKENS